jgi:hypothetical protein
MELRRDCILLHRTSFIMDIRTMTSVIDAYFDKLPICCSVERAQPFAKPYPAAR